MNIVTRYTVLHGGRIQGAVHLACDLMVSDPATFKQGYTRENALLAVQDAFSLTHEEIMQVGTTLLALEPTS